MKLPIFAFFIIVSSPDTLYISVSVPSALLYPVILADVISNLSPVLSLDKLIPYIPIVTLEFLVSPFACVHTPAIP